MKKIREWLNGLMDMVRIEEEKEKIRELKRQMDLTQSSKRKYMLNQEIKRRTRNLNRAIWFLKEAESAKRTG